MTKSNILPKITEIKNPNHKILFWIVPLAVLVLLALVFIPQLRGPEQASIPTCWPTQGWRNVHITVRMRFEGNHVVVEGQEASLELGVRFEGRIENFNK